MLGQHRGDGAAGEQVAAACLSSPAYSGLPSVSQCAAWVRSTRAVRSAGVSFFAGIR